MDKHTRAGHQNKHDSMRELADRLTKSSFRNEGREEMMTKHDMKHDVKRQKFAAGGVAKIRLGQCSPNGKMQLRPKTNVKMVP